MRDKELQNETHRFKLKGLSSSNISGGGAWQPSTKALSID